jgi:Cu(I)/Ag(I) efflux system membrane protein CusA/SilA
VAVWVGFIALFGTAVQTGMLMVLYLQEAVAKARARDGGRLTQAALRQAVVDGALLRLRPKVMTSSTVILSLLPIMWTSRVGADVLKPMAIPVLGGMVSSLLHVLVITPVIFFALRRRDTVDAFQRAPRPRRVALVVGIVAIVAVLGAGGWLVWRTRTSHDVVSSSASAVRVGAGESAGVRVAIFAPKDGVRVGAARLVAEFRDAATDAPIDVTGVRVSAAMPMPGMVMTAGLTPTAVGPGRFSLSGDFNMAGVWSFTVEWTRGTTPGQTAFDVEVH